MIKQTTNFYEEKTLDDDPLSLHLSQLVCGEAKEIQDEFLPAIKSQIIYHQIAFDMVILN